MDQSSSLKKRSVRVSGHDTSITLEEPFWKCLQDMAKSQNMSLNDLVSEIDQKRSGNLSSAIRIHILEFLQHR